MGDEKKKSRTQSTPLKDAVVLVSPKAVKAVKKLSKLTDDPPEIVLAKAICLYRTVKMKEEQGFIPAMVKNGKATQITGI